MKPITAASSSTTIKLAATQRGMNRSSQLTSGNVMYASTNPSWNGSSCAQALAVTHTMRPTTRMISPARAS